MARILLLGIESDLNDQLARVLHQLDHDVQSAGSMDSAARKRGISMIFAGGDAPDYRDTVRRLLRRFPGVPVILVNRLPENARWLDALELGAADYCGAPFEPKQVAWVVDSVLRQAAPVAAAA